MNHRLLYLPDGISDIRLWRILEMSYDENDIPFGVTWMPGGWNLNLMWNLRSGLPYTPTDASGTLIEGHYMSERTEWTDVMDLNFTKYFMLGQWKTSLWLEVRNLFNKNNVLHVDDNYGRVGNPNSFDSYTGEVGWVNDSVSPNYVQNPFAGPNPEAWDNPRYVRIGLGLEF
ncbi:MAG: hypothetical protein P9M15_02935 [Candidatus Electryoneaceae bacterium]|nr:hypothetical protein [Candidatus Electryoneaceae bacterium]